MACPTFLGNLAGRVAVITGGSSGIGAATAVQFARQGVRLALHGRSMDKLTTVQQQCVQEGLTGDEVLLVSGDLTKPADIQTLAASVLDKYGTTHMLVNSAGVVYATDATSASRQQLDHLFQMHVQAPLQLTQLLMQELIKNKGSIVNVSGSAGNMALPAINAYGITKAAMNHLTRALNSELAHKGVRVNSLCAGVVATEFLHHCGITKSKEETKQAIEMFSKSTLVGRAGTVEEMSRMIMFLASDACPYMIGQNLVVDGGLADATLVAAPNQQM